MAKSLFQAHMILGETVTDRDRHFSYFPLARMFERTVVTLMLHSGASIAFKHIDSRYKNNRNRLFIKDFSRKRAKLNQPFCTAFRQILPSFMASIKSH